MAKPLTLSIPFRFSSLTGSVRFSKVADNHSKSILSTSSRTKISLKIRCERKEKDLGTRRSRRKQNPKGQNVQMGGLGFAVLGALKTDLLPKNRIENTQKNTQINEAENTVNDSSNKQNKKGEKSETAHKAKNDCKGSLSKDSEALGASTLNSHDDLKLNSVVGTRKSSESDNTINGAPNKHKSKGAKVQIPRKAMNSYKGSLPKDSESSRASIFDNNEDLNLNPVVRTRKPSLSGQDILMALQRASVEKAKEARRNRRPKQKLGSTMDSSGLSDVRKGFGEIRRIVIKPEWATRIESLEKRLKELKQKADLT